MILVTGAGGKTGRAIVKALATRGERVRAFVHRDGLVATVMALGASEVSVGALDDARALSSAMTGVRAVYHICPNVSPNEVAFARSAVAAAQGAGVRRFVYHSVLRPQIEAMPHHWEKMRVEEMLFGTNLDVTILQPAAYMQNILAGWGAIVDDGVLRAPYPVETRLSLVDLDDVAEAAALVLTESEHAGATYELVGTMPLSQIEVAKIFSRALGRPVRAQAQSVAEWDAQARASGMGDYQRETLVRMFRWYADHGFLGNPNALRRLLGRAPTTLDAFAERAACSVTLSHCGPGR
jgi:NAD(P)H dehydrogenase (quinone)